MRKLGIALLALWMCLVPFAIGHAEEAVELSGYLNTDMTQALAEIGDSRVAQFSSDNFDIPVTFDTEYSNLVQEVFIQQESDFSMFGIRVGMPLSEAQGKLGSEWEFTDQYETTPYGESRPETWCEYKRLSDGLALNLAAQDDAVKRISVTVQRDYQIGYAESGTATISAYYGSEAEPEIPTYLRNGTVQLVDIGYGAFQNNLNLERITIPEGVTTIEPYAFSGCANLVSVVLPSTIASIGECAFENCVSLREINLPAQLYSAGEDVFQGCDSLNLTQGDESALIDTVEVAEQEAEAAIVVDEANLTELSGYLGTDFYSFVKEMGLSDDGATAGVQYSNDVITAYSDDESAIDSIELHKKANYCLEGVYVGMRQTSARKALLQAGWEPEESSEMYNRYLNDEGDLLACWYSDDRLVNSVTLMSTDDNEEEDDYDGPVSDAYGYTTGDVNLRSDPDKNSESMGVVPAGSEVSYLGESAVDDRGIVWYHVDFKGLQGWGSSKYVVIE